MAESSERQQAYAAWRRLMQPRGPVEDDQEEWDRKRDLETRMQKTGRDPVLDREPPQDRLYVDGEEIRWPKE